MSGLSKKLALYVVLASVFGCGAILIAQQRYVPSRSAGVTAYTTLPAPQIKLDPNIAQEYQQLETRIHALVREYHAKESEGRRDEIRTELETITQKQFELKNSVRKQELDRLRKQMDSVAAKLARREELREQIVERRVAELTKTDAELKWDSLLPPSPFVGSPIGLPGPARYPSNPSSFLTTSQRARVSKTAPTAGRPASGTSLDPFATAQTTARSTAANPFHFYQGDSMSVEEARTRLEIAQKDLELVMAQHGSGVVGQAELAKREGAYLLARVAYEQAQKALDIRRKQLAFEIGKAQLDLAAAEAKRDEISEIEAKVPNAIPQSQLREVKSVHERAVLILRQLEALADSLGDNGKSGPAAKKEVSR